MTFSQFNINFISQVKIGIVKIVNVEYILISYWISDVSKMLNYNTFAHWRNFLLKIDSPARLHFCARFSYIRLDNAFALELSHTSVSWSWVHVSSNYWVLKKVNLLHQHKHFFTLQTRFKKYYSLSSKIILKNNSQYFKLLLASFIHCNLFIRGIIHFFHLKKNYIIWNKKRVYYLNKFQYDRKLFIIFLTIWFLFVYLYLIYSLFYI